jgi:hypothetical protein
VSASASAQQQPWRVIWGARSGIVPVLHSRVHESRSSVDLSCYGAWAVALGAATIVHPASESAATGQRISHAIVVRGRAGLLAIDELQRVPSLLLAIKTVVDADPRPVRFRLIGSAHLFAVKDI